MNLIFNRRNIFTFFLLTGIVLLCAAISAVSIFAECVSQYSNLMPVYEDAELIVDDRHLANYIGLGMPYTVWFVEDGDRETVNQWYALTMGDMRRAQRDAERNDADKIPPIWDGSWRIVEVDNGVEVRLRPECYTG